MNRWLPCILISYSMLFGAEKSLKLTLLHTNDTHAHMEPFDSVENGRTVRLGGIAKRAALIKQIRSSSKTLLLDAGDVFQDTLYFNLFKGSLDYKLMSMMGYDAGTIGNHEFDNGVEGLSEALKNAKFPIVNCNFDLKESPYLQPLVHPFIVKEIDGFKIGITGVGVNFDGLVASKNHTGVKWIHPAIALPPVIKQLREVEKADMVILLSHLGTEAKTTPIDDFRLAQTVPGIDVIIGAHTHELYKEPLHIKGPDRETILFQVGYGGKYLGRMDFILSKP